MYKSYLHNKIMILTMNIFLSWEFFNNNGILYLSSRLYTIFFQFYGVPVAQLYRIK